MAIPPWTCPISSIRRARKPNFAMARLGLGISDNCSSRSTDMFCEFFIIRNEDGLPWWSSGKNPPCNARDTSSVPSLGRSQTWQGNEVHVPQLLSLCSGGHVLQLQKPAALEPVLCNKRSPCSNKDPAHPK